MIFTELKSGKTIEGAPIAAYKSDVKGSKYVYLMAGVHGDEVEGVYVLKNLFSWLQKAEQDFHLPLIVIPILNVDGYRMGSRLNSHAVDLNRNLPAQSWTDQFVERRYHPGPHPLSEPENQFLNKLFDKYRPAAVLSFHSWKPLLNYNGEKGKDICDYLSEFNGYPVSGDIGYETPGSLGRYVTEKYTDSYVVTFECPTLSDERPLKSIWAENEQALTGLFQSDLLRP